MTNKKVRRISAEGMIMALEYMAAGAMKHDLTNEDEKVEVTSMVGPDGFYTNNFAGMVFAVTHPWVELHSGKGICHSGDEAHEEEYRQMIKIMQSVLQARETMDD